MSAAPSPFRLEGRLVDPSLNRVTLPSGETAQVEPKIMQVLTVLAGRPGEVVTRDELMAAVWNGVFVTDDALHRAVRELRRLFDDSAESPRVIETIRKRGYRLIAAVEPVDRSGATGVEPVLSVDPRRLPTAGDASRSVVAIVVLASALAVAATIWILTLRPGSIDTEAHVRFTPLTSDPGNEIDPAMSPSGRLAYVARGDDGRGHLFSKAPGAASAVQITRGDADDMAPAWSPDDSKIAYVRKSRGSCAIWIAAADGREARMLLPCTAANELRMSWSPDGRRLAVTAGATTMRAPSHIDVIDVADGARRAVTQPPPAHSGDWSPAFSPDGRQIAFVRSVSGSISDVFVVDAAGGTPRRVTNDNADVLGVDWEPDGAHLVFSSDRAGGISLWRIAAAGGEPILLAGGGAKLKHPSVARRSGVVAYEDWQYEINLRELSTTDEEGSRAGAISPTSDRWNFHPQISPDGRRLVFQSTRSGQYELWLADRDGSAPRPLTRTEVYKSPARWSPDSRQIVFTTRVGSRTDVSALDVDTGALRTIARDSSSAVAPSWSADGRSIYFGSLRTGTWQIWNVEIATGKTIQVTADGGYAAFESPDRQWLFTAGLDRPGLWRRPLAGGAETLVTDRVVAEQWANWGFVRGGFYYVMWPDDGDPQLALLETGATAPRLLVRLPAYAWTGIAVSPDGARVIYAHADRRASNIGGLMLQK